MTFNPEDQRQCFQVIVLSDELNEGKEDFIVDITSVPDRVLTTRPDNAVVSILDANSKAKQYSLLVASRCIKFCHLVTQW